MACRTSTGWCCHTCPSTPRAPSEAQIINMMLAPASDGLHVFAGALHCGGRARRSRGSTPPERDSTGFPARGTLLYRIELPTVSRLYVSATPSREQLWIGDKTAEEVRAVDAAAHALWDA